MDNINNIILKDIYDIFTVFSQKGRKEEMVERRCYGLSFAQSGEITYLHNGITYVSDPSHAVILPKGQNYSIFGNKDGYFPVINFECDNFFTDTITILPVTNLKSLITDFERLAKAFYIDNNRLLCFSILYGILNNITENSNPCPTQLVPALEFIEENFCGEITNVILANQCGISIEYFRKLFKTAFGVSPKQYITSMRINKAKKMLAEGLLKINVVSEQCGFSNPYHFCRFFKSKTGFSPSEYMKKNKSYKI